MDVLTPLQGLGNLAMTVHTQGSAIAPPWAIGWSPPWGASQLPRKRLMQQRLFQFVQRRELLLVDGFEALSFCW